MRDALATALELGSASQRTKTVNALVMIKLPAVVLRYPARRTSCADATLAAAQGVFRRAAKRVAAESRRASSKR
jgi:hypothetical protein